MILNPKLKTVDHPRFANSRLSNTKIKLLKPGDKILIELENVDTLIECTVVFRRYDDIVAKVVHSVNEEVKPDQIIALDISNVIVSNPIILEEKLYSFMLVSTKNGDQEFVLHARFPKFIAVVGRSDNNRIKLEIVQLYDVPDSDEEIITLIKKAEYWYYGSFIRQPVKQ